MLTKRNPPTVLHVTTSQPAAPAAMAALSYSATHAALEQATAAHAARTHELARAQAAADPLAERAGAAAAETDTDAQRAFARARAAEATKVKLASELAGLFSAGPRSSQRASAPATQ